MTSSPILSVKSLGKEFTLHLQGGKSLPVVSDITFDVHAGECVVLGGPSGAGKSSILKMIFGSYGVGTGEIIIQTEQGPLDLATADAREVIGLRHQTIGYVSQFLRVIPRVSARDIVAEPAILAGMETEKAHQLAESLMQRLHVPERLWSLPPATFSGGEQQRVNIARGFAGPHGLLLLDEPTASLDAKNRAAVVEMIKERKANGTALLGIFHDEDVRSLVADRIVDVTPFSKSVEAA